mmetsp:Transcript_5080/g.7573  ORF Transcript_5080/g.7573 Transcript_5080/m.7573 type:complete len:181 (-) Transcript_5080:237-779(-)
MAAAFSHLHCDTLLFELFQSHRHIESWGPWLNECLQSFQKSRGQNKIKDIKHCRTSPSHKPDHNTKATNIMKSAILMSDATNQVGNVHRRNKTRSNLQKKKRKAKEDSVRNTIAAEQTESICSDLFPRAEDKEEQMQDAETDMIMIKYLRETLNKLMEINGNLRKEGEELCDEVTDLKVE